MSTKTHPKVISDMIGNQSMDTKSGTEEALERRTSPHGGKMSVRQKDSESTRAEAAKKNDPRRVTPAGKSGKQ